MAHRTTVAILFGIFVLLITGASGKLDAGFAERRAANGGSDAHFNGELPTNTNTPLPPTNTNTPLPPTNTNTPLPPTNTNTPLPPTNTNTPLPPTNTNTPGGPTNTPVPINTSTPTNIPNTPTPTPAATKSPTKIDLSDSRPGTGFDAQYLKGSDAVQIVGNDLSIQSRKAKLVSATIKITNLKDGAAERLTIDLFDTEIEADQSKDGVLRLTGRDTVANYEKVLRTTSYRNTAIDPNTAVRKINFVVYDGQSNSNRPVSNVTIVDSGVQIMKEPDLQTIAKGGTAEFVIEVTNIGGGQLININVADPLAPGCARQIASLNAGAKTTITCGVSSVSDEFTNVAIVEAVDDFGNVVNDEDTARVEVQNPNIQIVKSPSSQTLLKGEKATFNILVVNTSKAVDLEDVEVKDPLVPSCNKQVGSLGTKEEVVYSCEKNSVAAPFTNEITVSGRNIFNNEIVTDSSIAAVEILDMQASLAAAPPLLDLGGGSVVFDVVISNTGSVPFTLQSLVTDAFGAIDDPDNHKIENNSCTSARSVRLDSNESYACSFTADIVKESGVQVIDLAVSAKDDEKNIVMDTASAGVIIADSSKLVVSLEAVPASLPAPGGIVEERILVTNLTSGTAIRLDTLHHSVIGSLRKRGDCSLPQNLDPEESYGCTINIMVAGEIGSSISHILSAAGQTKNGLTVGDVDQASISHFDPAKRGNWLPIVARPERHPEEDNDGPCESFPLIIGETYEFTLDDQFDWYYFDVTRSGKIIVKLDNLVSPDAQAAVYANNSCKTLSGEDLVSYNGDEQSSKRLVFSARAGRHFLVVADVESRSIEMPYTVSVQAPQ